ncbi:MAG: 6-phosphogluconolactonase [Desulfobacterales bacterium]|nr:6-phosphogluconolactonase [Desulfobacterales bacterium]
MKQNRQIIIIADADLLARKGAEIFSRTAKETIAQQDRFIVAISGGSTPRAMHRLLSQEPYLSDIAWQKTYIFWVDDRMVAVDHPDSNFGTAQKDFLDKIPIPSDQVYPIPTLTHPDEGAALYEMTLKTFFQRVDDDAPIFDLIFLGIGKDGHIASLFPNHASRYPGESWVITVKGGDPDVVRITLAYSVLNNARHICFLVSGRQKAPIIKTLFENRRVQLPAGRIKPIHGKVTWLLDREAASLLSDTVSEE